MTNTQRLRYGVIGCANILRRDLIRGFRAAANAEPYAIASRTLAKAQQWAADLGIPRAYGSYEELLADPHIDAVYIPLPNHLHGEWTIKAAQAGKHVLCEKPLALDAAEAQRMADACAQAGVVLLEAFMYRFHPQTVRLQQLVADEVVGPLKVVRGGFSFFMNYNDNVRWTREWGGGGLMDVGCYPISLTRLLLGAEPTTAYAAATFSPTDVDEVLTGLLRFPGERHMIFDCAFRAAGGQSMTFIGERGRIEAPVAFLHGLGPTTITIHREGRVEAIECGPADEYQLMIEAFGRAVLQGEPLPVTPADAVGNMRAIDALLQSARTGVPVSLSTT